MKDSRSSTSLRFDDQSRFIIENFSQIRPFSSFLPGIAGFKGIPLWLFYVNRGQGIASFGTRDKDGAILEFLPADKSYQQVALTGFRTFIKELTPKGSVFYEPFAAIPDTQNRTQMTIEPHEFKISEQNIKSGWETEVVYFTLPAEPFAALVRQVTLRNTSNRVRRIELLDGLPAVMPSGLINSYYKDFGYTLQSWMDVFNLNEGFPFYRLRSSFIDQAEVHAIENGNFYLAFSRQDSKINSLKALVEPQLVFGPNTSLTRPDTFIQNPISDLHKKKQKTANHMACGFFGDSFELAPESEVTLTAYIGHVSNVKVINQRRESLCDPIYVQKARSENRRLVESLTETMSCKTALPLFDAYSRQTYLDNFLRGGVPVFLGDPSDPKIYHVYSRRHGDLERDYNFFTLLPEYYSQGNGGYRDINQNRRMDVWFNPRVGDFNLRMFFSLIQTDGYNPFVVKGCDFTLSSDQSVDLLKGLNVDIQDKLSKFFSKPFTPGGLLMLLENEKSHIPGGMDSFFQKILTVAKQGFEADFKEGCWTDHWVYNLDLLENFVNLYPDREEKALFNDRTYYYFESHAVVKPRSEKYVLVGGEVRQLDSLQEQDDEKAALHKKRQGAAHWMRTSKNQESPFQTTLYAKLANLAAVKFSTLDPAGAGLEMEAGKPGWNDSLNGLPSFFGSSIPETFELKRLLLYLKKVGDQFPNQKVLLPVEVDVLLQTLYRHAKTYLQASAAEKNYVLWDSNTTAREIYRAQTKLGFSGNEKEIEIGKELSPIWDCYLSVLNEGLEKILLLGKGVYPTYLRFNAEKFEVLLDEKGAEKRDEKGRSRVKVLEWKPMVLPLFLEGPAKALKVQNENAKSLYQKVKKTGLYDSKLNMYKVCESLADQPHALGRICSFTPGWLENESIFLHMSYKYLLAILKAGLYQEFFSDIKTMFIPFLDPAVYGRSTLENSSFLVSSANPDETLHGGGFTPRLSGSSAEFLNIWTVLMVGSKPFSFEKNELAFKLAPCLPGWLFDEKGSLSFRLFGSCDATYHNPSRRDTFDKDAVIEKMVLEKNGSPIQIEGPILKGALASDLREGRIGKLQIYFKT